MEKKACKDVEFRVNITKDGKVNLKAKPAVEKCPAVKCKTSDSR
jgi:hypothetical protein